MCCQVLSCDLKLTYEAHPAMKASNIDLRRLCGTGARLVYEARGKAACARVRLDHVAADLEAQVGQSSNDRHRARRFAMALGRGKVGRRHDGVRYRREQEHHAASYAAMVRAAVQKEVHRLLSKRPARRSQGSRGSQGN